MSKVAAMGKYKPYPAYKDSGIEWLGDVPEHWEGSKFKFLGDAIIGLTYSPNDIVEENEGTIVLRSTNLQNGKVSLHSNVAVNSTIPSKLRTKKNDILICSRNGSRALIGKNAKIDAESANMTFGAFTTIYRTESHRYLYWVLNSSLFDYQSGSFLTTTINQLTTGNLNSFETPLPSEAEQIAIANFLDQETSKIDLLIEKQQKLIELLKEKRQAVISYAVTKGLNPNAKMKDSGIQWLGDIPEHWEIMQVRYATEIYRGKFTHRPRNDPKLYDGEYPFIQTGDVARANKLIESYKQTLNENGIRVSQKFPKGSLVMAIAANIGDVAILDFDSYAPDSVVSFKPRNNMNLFYLRYFFIGLLDILKSTAIQSTQANLNIERVGELKNGIPPLQEQLIIVDNLNTQTQKIDTLIDKSQQAIELLKERKTALISAAVTGKIDVRGRA